MLGIRGRKQNLKNRFKTSKTMTLLQPVVIGLTSPKKKPLASPPGPVKKKLAEPTATITGPLFYTSFNGSLFSNAPNASKFCKQVEIEVKIVKPPASTTEQV